ncbi:MAG: glycosyl transferase [Tahibacter sp.]
MLPALFRRQIYPPAWLILWFAVALFAIFQHGPMPLYSTRTLAVAWEMWQRGEFLVPHINGAPYSHKVPLLFWMIHAGWALTGVNDIWPRVLEVLIGAGWLLAASALARRVFNFRPAVARLVPWFLIALSYSFLFGLQIMYEVLLAFWVALALYCLAGKPRWLGFALCVGAGLMTKGPVMLLQVAFPLLLGPWWSEHARADRRAWFLSGSLALLGGFALLLAWALPAGFAGGAEYRNELFFMQTAGRVMDSFDHARPLWWYLPVIPILLFPWIGWPRLLRAVWVHRRPLGDGERFLIAWLVPTLLTFSLVSGKQVYYLLPLLPGAAMLLARALSRASHSTAVSDVRSVVWSPWPLALAGLAFAVMLMMLPVWLASGRLHSHWLHDAASLGPWFGVVLAVLSLCLLAPAQRAETQLKRIAAVALLGAATLHALFAYSLFHNFDLRPISAALARAQAQHKPIAIVGIYEGQFHFIGRLHGRIAELRKDDVATWAAEHPDGVIVRGDRGPSTAARRFAALIQPFRSHWLVLWDARTLAAVEAGGTPAEPLQRTELYPPNYWRYHSQP